MPPSKSDLIAAANAHLSAGRHAEALPILTRLARTDKRAAILENLGVCHYSAGDHATALKLLEAARRRPGANASILSNIAVISSEIGPARIHDPAALDARAWNAVGLNAYFRGDFADARAALVRAVDMDPDYFVAFYNLSDLIERDEAEDWLTRMDRLRPEAPGDIAVVAYARAHLLDMLGRWREAAEAWATGGAARIEADEEPFDAESQNRIVDGLIANFTPARLDALRLPAEPSAPRLIFIVGMPRSGSTLTARLLATDPALTDLGESRAFPTALIAELERLGGGPRAPFSAIDRDAIARIRDRYLGSLPDGAAICLDKYPENSLFLGLIHAAFPEARFIHTRRDPYDTMISCYSKLFTMGNAWSYRPEDIRAYYDAHMRIMDHWFAALPPGVLIASDYDALTSDPAAALARLSAHCGVNARHDAAPAKGKVLTASAKQVREGVQRRDGSRYDGYRPYIRF